MKIAEIAYNVNRDFENMNKKFIFRVLNDWNTGVMTLKT